jgi:integrase
LTDTAIKGLSARIRKTDGALVGNWALRTTNDGKTTRVSLGDFATMDGTHARAAAIQARNDALQGAAVQSYRAEAKAKREAARKAAQQAAEAATSLHDLLFVDTPTRRSFEAIHWQDLKSGDNAVRQVKNFLGDEIHRPANSFTPQDFEQIFMRKADTAPHSAARGLAYLRPAMKHLAKRGHVAPGLLDLCEDHTISTTRRDRILTQGEWVAIWNSLSDSPAHAAVKILSLTGARNREVAAMRADELHLEKAEWHLPTDRSKNGDPHIFCLPPRAVEILRARIELNEAIGHGGGPVFTTDGTTPVWLGSKIKAAIDSASGVHGWRFHDLRRTFATALADRGVSDALVDQMLNHRASASRGGVAGTYNRSLRLTDRHAAAARWGQITDGWVDGTTGTVVKIA